MGSHGDPDVWGRMQTRDVMVYFIYCSFHWTGALNLKTGVLGFNLDEIKYVSQVIKKSYHFMCGNMKMVTKAKMLTS